MPILLEKPGATPPTSHASHLLHSRHRWASWRGILIAGLAGLTITLGVVIALHSFWQMPLGNRWLILAWAGGIGATAIAAAVGWSFGPASLEETALMLDRNLATKNRLEAAATLHRSASPLAAAQRDETTAYLVHEPRARPVRALPWVVAAVVVLIIAHLVTLGVWVHLAPPTPAAPKPPPRPKEPPRATITWKSPEPESKANPVEEVPTVAVAESTGGLRDMTLEISVNGDARKSVPLPAAPYNQAGRNIVKVSLYMDELGVEPYDVVAYFLRAQRITDQKMPETTSAIQFIQVQPFRDDVKEVGGGPQHKNYDLLIRLKLAQLRAIKENFVLAHTDLQTTDPVWLKENKRVGQNQGDLSAKTEEVVQLFIQTGVPASIVDLLRRAEPPMTDASKKILAFHNIPALPPQERALNLIIQAEKFFIKVEGKDGTPGPQSSNPDDPFKNKQKHELKKRFQSAAGQLEQLAQNQAKLATDIAQNHEADPGDSPAPDDSSAPPAPAPASPAPSGGQNPAPATPAAPGEPPLIPLPPAQTVDPFAPGADKGTFDQRQARVLQGIEILLNLNKVLPDDVTQALQEARTDATASLQQLDQKNQPEAREPAAATAEDLARAVEGMNNSGEKETLAVLQEGQHQLNELAQQLSDLAKTGTPATQQGDLAKIASKARDIQKKLEDAADHQQEAGSAPGAQRLSNLAAQMQNQNVAQDLDGMGKTGFKPGQALAIVQTLQSLALDAAQGLNPGKPSAQDLSRLLTSLQSSRANLARLAEKEAGPGMGKPGDQPPPLGQGAPDAGKPGAPPSAPGQGGPPPADAPGAGKPAVAPSGFGQGGTLSTETPPDHHQAMAASGGRGHSDPNSPPTQEEGSGQGKTSSKAPPSASPTSQGDEGGGNGTAAEEEGPPNPEPSQGTGGQSPGGSDTEKEYHEVLGNIKDELQQAAPVADTKGVEKKLEALDDTAYRTTNSHNIVAAYQAIAPPLDQLIVDLSAVVARAQREDLIKQPDLDEAPAAYRRAVSAYFEAMSRDYHPADTGDAKKKP